jgi:hypothetical protein
VDPAGRKLLLGIEIDAMVHQVLVDTGASVSVMKPGIAASEIRTMQTTALGITGAKLRITGIQMITFKVGKRNF